MADNTTDLKVRILTENVDKLRGLSSSLSKLSKGAKAAGINVNGLIKELKQKERTELKSINNTRALSNSYRELARQVDMGSREFREATREANRLDASLRRVQRTSKRGIGGGLGGAVKTAGAIGAAGIFGGVEGAIGATVGGIFGGTGGAVVGGTAGAALGGVRRAFGDVAEYTAQLRQQQFALKLIIKDTEKYEEAQRFLAKTSEDLAIPQDVIVRQFTALTASVTGAGKSVKDAQDVFLSIASGIRGTGGSLEDMRSAMVATAQVFSKGKVSAEELRQQLGERLPGAFTLFAASMDMTPAQLDKALEQGKVSLDDFMGFSKHLFENYGENAKILASSPAAAGDRLRNEFSKLKLNFGGLFANIGFRFQNFAETLLKFLNNNQDKVKKFITNIANFFIGGFNVLKKVAVDAFNTVKNIVIGLGKAIAGATKSVNDFLNNVINTYNATVNKLKNVPVLGAVFKNFKDIESVDLGKIARNTLKNLGTYLIGGDEVVNDIKKYSEELKKVFKNSFKLTEDQIFNFDQSFLDLIEKTKTNIDKLGKTTENLKEKTTQAFTNMKDGLQGYLDSIKDVNKQVQDSIVNAFKNMEDAVVKFAITGKLNFSNFAKSLLDDMTKIIIRQKVMLPMLKTINRSFNLGLDFNATGGVFNKQGKMQGYAKGGVVTQPTFFRYGGMGNLGLMGEGGNPEAILPLKRGRSGNLGVEASGNNKTNIVVNVDASGTSSQGSNPNATRFGEELASAIQAVIINEKRVGGLLN